MKATSIPRRQLLQRWLALWRRGSTELVRSSWEQGSGWYPAVPTARLIRLQIRPTPTWLTRRKRWQWVTAHSLSLRPPLRATRQAILSQLHSVASATTLRTRDQYRAKETCSRRVTWTPRLKQLSSLKNPTQIWIPSLGKLALKKCHPLLRPLRLPLQRSHTFRQKPLPLKRRK